MLWLTWRQFRIQALAAVAALAVIATGLAITGPRLAHLYATSGLPSCASTTSCEGAQSVFEHGLRASGIYSTLYFVGVVILYATPALIGMFWGAPLITRELEADTFRLAWSQSLTRSRWLAVKLALVGLAALLAAGLLSLAVSWWSSPIDRANALSGQDLASALPNRFMPVVFGARDVAPIGYAAFAFSLGVGIGFLLRRTLPAMAVTLAVLAVVQIVVPMSIRADYLAPARTSAALIVSPDAPQRLSYDGNTLTISTPVAIPGAWVTSVQTVDSAGHAFTGPPPGACTSATASATDCDSAINQLHLRQIVDYQPASRYWTFQWIETAVYLVLTLVLTSFSAWRIRHLRLN